MTIPKTTNEYDKGYEVLLSLHDPEAYYSFDTYIVCKVHSPTDPCDWNDTSEYFWAHDSGCSCPTPFESAETFPLTEETYGQLHDEVSKRTNYNDEPYYGPEAPDLAAAWRLIKGL